MMNPKSLLELTTEHLKKNFEKYDRNKLRPMLAPLVTIREMTLAKFHQEIEKTGSRCKDRFLAAWSTLYKSKHCLVFPPSDFVIGPCESNLTNTVFREVIQNLPFNAPNLQTMSMTGFRAELSLSLLEREIDSIVKLTRLTRLNTCGVSMSMSGFLKILEHCKKLEYMEAEISNFDVEVPSSIISDAFDHYIFDGQMFHDGKLFLTLRKNGTDMCDLRETSNRKRIVQICINPLSIAKIGIVKNLYNHFTYLLITEGRPYCSLDVKGEGKTVDQLPHFPNLKDVHFKVTSAIVFQKFIIQSGQNLVHLSIYNVPSGLITLDQLFRWCPNLESLSMVQAIVSGNKVPVEHLRRLRQFTCFDGGSSLVIPMGSILMAPLIEEIDIVDGSYQFSMCDFGNEDALIRRIDQREILKNLEYIRIEREQVTRSLYSNADGFYKQIIQTIKDLRYLSVRHTKMPL